MANLTECAAVSDGRIAAPSHVLAALLLVLVTTLLLVRLAQGGAVPPLAPLPLDAVAASAFTA